MASMNEIFRDTTGGAGAAKYAYQGARVAKGLSKSTRLTAAVDLLKGGASFGDMAGVADAGSGVSSTAKGAAGMAKFSRLGKVASFAGKAGPILTKGSCVLGAAMGGYQVGSGIHEITQGNKAEGRD